MILYGTSATKEPPMRAAIGIASILALCPRLGIPGAQRFGHYVVRSAFCAMGAMLIGLPGTPAQGQCTPPELAKLTASDATENDNFGSSVAISGDTVVVGAYKDNHAGTGSGSAYIFTLSGGVWTQQSKLTASDAAANEHFGVSVAISGDTVVVGAWIDELGRDRRRLGLRLRAQRRRLDPAAEADRLRPGGG
jgi:hypothetical protein